MDTAAGVAPGAGAWYWAWCGGNARHCLYADGAKVVSGVLDTRHNVFPVPVSRPNSGHLPHINPCLFTPVTSTREPLACIKVTIFSTLYGVT